jgi:hypothetical protein
MPTPSNIKKDNQIKNNYPASTCKSLIKLGSNPNQQNRTNLAYLSPSGKPTPQNKCSTTKTKQSESNNSKSTPTTISTSQILIKEIADVFSLKQEFPITTLTVEPLRKIKDNSIISQEHSYKAIKL